MRLMSRRGPSYRKPFRVLLDFMKNDNCWVKVCGAERVSSQGPPFTDAVPFARALLEAAPDRVLGAPIGRIRTSASTCLTTATWWT